MTSRQDFGSREALPDLLFHASIRREVEALAKSGWRPSGLEGLGTLASALGCSLSSSRWSLRNALEKYLDGRIQKSQSIWRALLVNETDPARKDVLQRKGSATEKHLLAMKELLLLSQATAGAEPWTELPMTLAASHIGRSYSGMRPKGRKGYVFKLLDFFADEFTSDRLPNSVFKDDRGWLPPKDKLFEESSEGAERLALEKATDGSVSTWWSQQESLGWFDSLFTFWGKTGSTIPAEAVTYELSANKYPAEFFGLNATYDAPRQKAVLESMSVFGDDRPKVLHCGETNWGLVQHVESNGLAFLDAHPGLSVFGFKDQTPVPGIVCVHGLLLTADDWFLLSFRSLKNAYNPETWSASFEEQVKLWNDVNDGEDEHPDANVLDSVRRGIWTEFYLPPSSVEEASVVAIGREYSRAPGKPEVLVMGAAVLVAVRLGFRLGDVWDCLDVREGAIDRDEHGAWMACRFDSLAALNALLSDTRPGAKVFAGNIAEELEGIEVQVYQDPQRDSMEERVSKGWHPTSRTRLYLGASWIQNKSRRA